MQRIRGHGYITFHNIPALFPKFRIRAIFTVIFQSGSIQILPGMLFITFFITVQVIAVDQTIEQPYLEEPWFIILFNDLFTFQVNTDKNLVRPFSH